MLRNKYKLLRNHGLLPKLAAKPSKQIITTYALLNKGRQKDYQLFVHPQQNQAFVLFNQSQFLHRKCSQVIVDNDASDTISAIAELYPQEGQTLAMFIANDPKQTSRLILGSQNEESLLSLAYKQLQIKRGEHSQIVLSIIGIENQNSLTDQLCFQQITKGQKVTGNEPFRLIRDRKGRVDVGMEVQSHSYIAQNVSKHGVKSIAALKQILTKYCEVKNYLEGWAEVQQRREYYQMGQIYHLSEVEYNQEGRIKKTINNHYILRINQYLRTSSPLLLRLGMYLKRINTLNHKWLDFHDSKVFRLLSDCFVQQCQKNKKYNYHLFLQVGQYHTFKQQYFCLVPTSQFVNSNKLFDRCTTYQKEFMYYKHYLENAQVMKVISDLEGQLPEQSKEHMQIYIKAHENNLNSIKARLNTKSYHCDTASSVEKKKQRGHMHTQGNQHYSKIQLEELVEETSKIYRFSQNKFRQEGSNIGSRLESKRSLPKNFRKIGQGESKIATKLNSRKVTLTEGCEESTPAVDRSLEFARRIEKSGRKQSNIKHFNQVKEWLGFVYGRNRSNKLKGLQNSTSLADRKSTQVIKNRKKNINKIQKKEQTKKVRKLSQQNEEKGQKKVMDYKMQNSMQVQEQVRREMNLKEQIIKIQVEEKEVQVINQNCNQLKGEELGKQVQLK